MRSKRKENDRPYIANGKGAVKMQMNMPIRNNFIPIRNSGIQNIPIKQKTEELPRSFAINKYYILKPMRE